MLETSESPHIPQDLDPQTISGELNAEVESHKPATDERNVINGVEYSGFDQTVYESKNPRYNGVPHTYGIQDGKKKHITTDDVMRSYGYDPKTDAQGKRPTEGTKVINLQGERAKSTTSDDELEETVPDPYKQVGATTAGSPAGPARRRTPLRAGPRRAPRTPEEAQAQRERRGIAQNRLMGRYEHLIEEIAFSTGDAFRHAERAMDEVCHEWAEMFGFSDKSDPDQKERQELLLRQTQLQVGTQRLLAQKGGRKKLNFQEQASIENDADNKYMPRIAQAIEELKADPDNEEIKIKGELLMQEYSLMTGLPDESSGLAVIKKHFDSFFPHRTPKPSLVQRGNILLAHAKKASTVPVTFAKQGWESAKLINNEVAARNKQRLAKYEAKHPPKPGRRPLRPALGALGIAGLVAVGAIAGSGDNSSDQASFAPDKVTAAAPEDTTTTTIPENTTTTAKVHEEVVAAGETDEGGEQDDEGGGETDEPPVEPAAPVASDHEQDVNNGSTSNTSSDSRGAASYRVTIDGQKDSNGDRWLSEKIETDIGLQAGTEEIDDNDRAGQKAVMKVVRATIAANGGRVDGELDIPTDVVAEAVAELKAARGTSTASTASLPKTL